jgi:predicted transcriptional regulator
MYKKEKLIKILEDAKYLGVASDAVADRILNLFSVVVPKGTLCETCNKLDEITITLCKECYLESWD